jgi:hypothetical protein
MFLYPAPQPCVMCIELTATTVCISTFVLFVTTVMQGIYNHIPQTKLVSMAHSVAALPYLQFMIHVTLFPMLNVLYFYSSNFRSMFAVPYVALLCGSLISCFPNMLPRYFLNYFDLGPIAPIINGIYFVFYIYYYYYYVNIYRRN